MLLRVEKGLLFFIEAKWQTITDRATARCTRVTGNAASAAPLLLNFPSSQTRLVKETFGAEIATATDALRAEVGAAVEGFASAECSKGTGSVLVAEQRLLSSRLNRTRTAQAI